jgi:hypothetical protein
LEAAGLRPRQVRYQACQYSLGEIFSTQLFLNVDKSNSWEAETGWAVGWVDPQSYQSFSLLALSVENAYSNGAIQII